MELDFLQQQGVFNVLINSAKSATHINVEAVKTKKLVDLVEGRLRASLETLRARVKHGTDADKECVAFSDIDYNLIIALGELESIKTKLNIKSKKSAEIKDELRACSDILSLQDDKED